MVLPQAPSGFLWWRRVSRVLNHNHQITLLVRMPALRNQIIQTTYHGSALIFLIGLGLSRDVVTQIGTHKDFIGLIPIFEADSPIRTGAAAPIRLLEVGCQRAFDTHQPL